MIRTDGETSGAARRRAASPTAVDFTCRSMRAARRPGVPVRAHYTRRHWPAEAQGAHARARRARHFNFAEARERARLRRQQIKDGIRSVRGQRAAEAERELSTAKALTFSKRRSSTFAIRRPKSNGAMPSIHQYMATLSIAPAVDRRAVIAWRSMSPRVLRCSNRRSTRSAAIPPGRSGRQGLTPLTAARPDRVGLGSATVRGYGTGDNPARWRGHLSETLSAGHASGKVEHHPALRYAELPVFIGDLPQREAVAAQALEFTILTAARTGEMIGARWPEFDLEAGSGRCPPDG